MIETARGYKTEIDEYGIAHLFDLDTNEEIEGSFYHLPKGTDPNTEKDRQRRRDRLAALNEKKLQRRMQKDELGNFYFAQSREQFEDIAPEVLAKLIYLNTYIEYNTNRLKYKKGIPMRYKHLREVLNIKEDAVKHFWKAVNPKYIIEKDDGLMFTNNDFFKKGDMPRHLDSSYQMMRIDGIRSLYRSVATTGHRYLGYIFQLLPYVNVEYNLVCHNPYETDLEKIELMTVGELCGFLKYDKSHWSRLRTAYLKIKFPVEHGSRSETCCNFVYNGGNGQNMKMFINPRIFYCGHKHKEVQILGAFCKV